MTEKNLELMKKDRDRCSRIRLVVTDLDGTFLNKKSDISPRNLRAVQALRDAGLEFAVCTGRRYEDAIRVLEKGRLCCAMVAMNGAALYDIHGNTLRQHSLTGSQAAEVVRRIMPWRDKLLIQIIAGDKVYVMSREEVLQKFFSAYVMPEEGQKEEREALLASYVRVTEKELPSIEETFYKVEIMSEDEELIRQIREPLGQVKGISIGASFATNWEITSEKASKGAGLTDFAELHEYGLCQVMAMGDGDNDRTMLSLPLGWSVSMGNGTEYIKGLAHVITGTNEEDGFAQAVEALLECRRAPGQ